ncbi:hypothetical protein FACS189472_11080 [Alphaproteobacteria bacterium]|nr:hypothetical protein FACS189472_11080 [Alphaproteobacteria bacterium]
MNLSFEKHSSTATSLTSQNDNSSKNNNTINLNIIHPSSETYGISPPVSPRALTPKPQSPQKMKRANSISSRKSPIRKDLDIIPERLKRDIKVEDEYEEEMDEIEMPIPYKSPDFSEIQNLFKDQLTKFLTDILLNDFDSLKSVSERSNKVLFHLEQLKQLIAILYLNEVDRKDYDKLIEIEDEPITMSSCFLKKCNNPFIRKIKSIYINKSVNFLTTPYAVNMNSEFRISLEYCLTDKIIEQK